MQIRADNVAAGPNQTVRATADCCSQRDTAKSHAAHFAMVLAIFVIGIVGGSLYPFDLRVPTDGIGPVATLLESWSISPGRGDALANILLYMPFGLFAVLSLRHRPRFYWLLPVIIVAGFALSTTMELTQYYDEGRVTSAADVYTNTLGTILGVIAGCVFRFDARILMIGRMLSNPVPTMLLVTWVAYRLFPYEPTIDLHKYWNTLKPLLQSPTLSTYDLYRHTVILLTVFTLLGEIVGKRGIMMVLFASAVLSAKVAIISATLSIAEIGGAALALCLWPAFAAIGRHWLILLVLLLAGYVIMERLEPFDFLPVARPFGWTPFGSFLAGGSLEVNILSFFEKVFLYGSLIFLLAAAGMRLTWASLLVAIFLFATSWVETYLPSRSAEITDAIMALLLGAMFSSMRLSPRPRAQPEAPR